MKIQEAATKIVSAWEHTGHYDCHGDGAYGLIGWERGQLVSLLEHYVAEGGTLAFTPAQYNPLTSKLEPELNERAEDPLMRSVQMIQAHGYMTSAIKYQWEFYPFKTALGQLIICDIGVNSGIWNNYVKHCGAYPGDAEDVVLYKVMKYRRSALNGYGIWQQYEGIRRRWQFYQDLLDSRSDVPWGSWPHGQTLEVNGVYINLDEEIEPLV